ncbi:hypothetical protein [Lichenihabitans psoromatis]|uniref:hypothetical protein n=1 Tax=Lichenihabitans psoromatis TaxID=2528642 RepID=UPI0010384FA1|nr:hypothetical protein [Lichenihabitans psoromatis]
MATYMVHIATTDATHDYAPLWGALDRLQACRAFIDVWFVDTYQPVDMMMSGFRRLLTEGDRLFLLQISERALLGSLGMMPEAQRWLEARRP